MRVLSKNSSARDAIPVAALLFRLSALTRHFANYGMNHPLTQEALLRYTEQCGAVRQIASVDGDELLIVGRGDRLYFGDSALPDQGQPLHLFLQRMRHEHRSGFLLSLKLAENELRNVLLHLGSRVTALGDEYAEPLGFRWLNRRELAELTVRHHHRPTAREHLLVRVPELRVDEKAYMKAVGELSAFMKQCATEDDARLKAMSEIIGTLVDQVLERPEALLPLVTVPYFDEFTEYHSVNVCLLTLYAARLISRSREALNRIGLAALLHDLGKSRVPLEVLYKSGRLSEAEKALILEHPTTGARLLQNFGEIDPLAVSVAFGHHIKDHGTGYPKVSEKYNMGPITALVEVVDIFEALTALRPYKKPLPAGQAFEALYAMPNMASKRPFMDLLFHSLGMHPVGSRVRTVTGELGIVCGHHENDPKLPIVRLVEKNAFGDLTTDHVVIGTAAPADDTAPPNHAKVTPVRTLDPEEDFELLEQY